ncbi:nickel-responsive transcriptional regulator NikR [Methanosarcinales archaeon]|nr:MAG: nickel-responsive transcriptional regulator NikR [Methanosarcinales archaeon]
MSDTDLTRIGVSLPETLLSRFDKIIRERGYSSRSEGIRDAIRTYINHYEWISRIEGEKLGVLTVVYDHSKRGLVDELTDIQHHALGIIHSSLHIHLDEENCLEIIILKGEGRAVKDITDRIMALRGVKHVRLNTVVPNP